LSSETLGCFFAKKVCAHFHVRPTLATCSQQIRGVEFGKHWQTHETEDHSSKREVGVIKAFINLYVLSELTAIVESETL
jgi:hypothetical protein